MTDDSYAKLLADLRRDLQLNPSTDLHPFALASAQNLPWKVDAGSSTVTFTAASSSAATTVNHRLGRLPVFVAAINVGAFNGIWFSATKSATQISFVGFWTGVTTGTFAFDWVAIG